MSIDREKLVGLSLGTLFGVCGFYYTNYEKHGRYSIGVDKISEFMGILLFYVAAVLSSELVSTVLLQMIAAWHIANAVYYWDETPWL